MQRNGNTRWVMAELSIGWVPPHTLSPSLALRPRKILIMECPFPGTGDTRSLLRVTLIPLYEMDPMLKYSRGRTKNNLNGEMHYEVNFVPSQERKSESSSLNLGKSTEV